MTKKMIIIAWRTASRSTRTSLAGTTKMRRALREILRTIIKIRSIVTKRASRIQSRIPRTRSRRRTSRRVCNPITTGRTAKSTWSTFL
jgi:hypothetical protein